MSRRENCEYLTKFTFIICNLFHRFQLFKNKTNFNGYCELKRNNNPWLLLGPIKTEFMSAENPFQVMMFHDILTDKEIEFMKNEGKSRLTRAGVLFSGNTVKNTEVPKVSIRNFKQKS